MTSVLVRKDGLAEGLLEVGWLLVAILVPLWINLWAKQPFELSKAALLRTLVWLMAAVWLSDAWLAQRSLWRDLASNPLLGPTLAVIGVQALATILAADWRLSLWGSYERAQGALTTLSYASLFLLVAARLRGFSQAYRLIGVMVVTGVPVVGLGLAQAVGMDPIGGLVGDARSPVYATLGRSNFVGAYLAMLLPLTLALSLLARRRWMRLASGFLLVGEVMVVALTLSRGAWLAAAVALGGFGLLWLWPRLARRWRVTAVLGAGFVLVCVVGGTLWLGRAGGSTAARLSIWQATAKLVARRPVLGYGLDGLTLVFPRVYPPQLVYYQGRGVRVDRAHNLFLDRAVTTGLVGLVAELTLLVAFLGVGWRAAQRASQPERRLVFVACLSAIGGNTVGNLVGFDVTATATATWLLMAVTVGLIAADEPADQSGLAVGLKSPLRWAAAGLVLLGVGMAVFWANVRPLMADGFARLGDQRAAAGDWAGAIGAGEQAVRLWPSEPAHRLSLAWVHLRQAQTGGGNPRRYLVKAEAELLAARDLRPADFSIWAALGELYGLWGNRWDVEKLALAHTAYRRATKLAPFQAPLYTAWGLVDLESGHVAEAADKFRWAIDLDATDGFAFSYLGQAALAMGQIEPALDAYRQAVYWEPELGHAYLGLAGCYWQLGQPEMAELSLRRALQLAPDDEAVWALKRRMDLEP